uniref:CNH domain-containing protein n=1 Tax=Caenorhabditis tropicalis TaxID=1561998 RepID=A0A1I7TNT0_9PELO
MLRLTIIPNSIVKAKHEKKRIFVGHQQDDCTEKCSLFYVRPIERGYVVNWDTQQQIWEKTFDHLDIEPTTSRIALTDNNHLVPALPDVSIPGNATTTTASTISISARECIHHRRLLHPNIFFS